MSASREQLAEFREFLKTCPNFTVNGERIEPSGQGIAQDKEARHARNLQGLTGFWHNTYYENGVPRPHEPSQKNHRNGKR
ncbi:MAG: hypothetical protein M1524_01970 [Patescibacteria group bacterium]|nr:hypothetical protein [Patescibacteria group bacterium]